MIFSGNNDQILISFKEMKMLNILAREARERDRYLRPGGNCEVREQQGCKHEGPHQEALDATNLTFSFKFI